MNNPFKWRERRQAEDDRARRRKFEASVMKHWKKNYQTVFFKPLRFDGPTYKDGLVVKIDPKKL